MANFNPLIKPKGHVSRNGFDLSQNHKFTAKPGMLLPVLSIDCVPNDYHEIDVLSLMKTMPVNTDAFARMKQHFEFFFVPYSLLWSRWHSFITQGQSEQTSVMLENITPIGVPCFNYSSFLSHLDDIGSLAPDDPIRFDPMGMVKQYNMLRLFDLLGYGAFQPALTDSNSIPTTVHNPFQYVKCNVFRAAAYQKIWYDYYRNKWYDTHVGSDIFNFDDIVNSDDTIEMVRRLDVFDDLFCLRYRQWKKDLFMSLMPSAQYGAVSAIDLNGIQLKYAGTQSSSNRALNVSGSGAGSLAFANGDSVLNGKFDVPNAFDVYALRRAEVLQKWKETTLRAGASAQSQYRGQYI